MKSYKAFQLIFTERKLMLKMHLAILKVLFIIQIILIILSFVISINNISPNNGSFKQVYSGQKNKSRNSNINKGLHNFLDLPEFRLIQYTFYGSFTIYLLWPVIIIFSRKKASHFGNKTIRGAQLVDEKKLNKLLPKGDNSLQLTDSITIPREYENRHFLCMEASGTGKTVQFSRVISNLKNRGSKGIIYDRKDGEMLAKFYNPQTDYIYNPFDQRTIYWNVLDNKKSDSDFDALASSVVPSATGKDKFFNDGARDILSEIFRYCYIHNSSSNEDIWDLLCLSVSKLHKCLLKINSAAAYILNYNSGQSQGIISTLYQYSKIFKYLRFNKDQKPFSLQEWVRDEKQQGYIFLTNNTKQRESLKGILSVFINSLANEILSLRDDLNRRLFIFLDEFGTLQRLDAVKDLIVLTRSKGCSFWCGIQDKSQLDYIYGPEISNTIVNNCNNYIIFRLNGYDNAKYFSDLLGESEKDFSLVLGQKDIQNQQSYRNYAKIDKLILPSEIQALPDLHFYLKLHGFPVTGTRTTYREFPEVADAFVPNTDFQSSKVSGQKQNHSKAN